MYNKTSTKKRNYPKDFENYKVLKLLKKKRSPLKTVFATNDPEGWFINVITYKNKSGEVSDVETIIEKDLKDWYEWHERMGWEKE
ncbi:MAG: hypothetical protein ACOC1K_01015 [Nanoarchaeota archaeon]